MAMDTATATVMPVNQARADRHDASPLAVKSLLHTPSLHRVSRASTLLACLAAFATAQAQAQAQEAAPVGRSGTSLTPRVTLSQTWTDNNTLSSGAKDAALITVLSPGLTLASKTGMLKGSLDYAVSGVFYGKSEQKDRTQQSLTASGVAELIDNFLFVDGRATIGRQLTSAFGQQSVDQSLNNPNSTEVATVNFSPFVRGRLFGLASYELRGTYAETNAKGTSVSDSTVVGSNFRLDSASFGQVGWWINGNTQRSHFKSGVDNNTALVSLGLRYQPDVDWLFRVNAGRESSDYQLGVATRGNSYGASANWQPTPRTTLLADWQSHDYGNSHLLSFEHRMPRSVWRVSDSQNVSTQTSGNLPGQNTNYDLLFTQYASIEPDPIKRDAKVRQTLLELGLNANAAAANSYLNAGPTLVRTQGLSFSFEALRTTLTASATQSTTKQLGNGVPPGGVGGQTGNIVQRNGSINLARNLTPTTSANVSYTQSETLSDASAVSSSSTTLRSVTANWTMRLNPRSSVSLGGRVARFHSPLLPYRENAVFATLVHQF